MKHAGPEALDQLEPILEEIRRLDGVKEKKRGSFSCRSGGFSHFGFSIPKNSLDEMVLQIENAGGKLRRRGEHAPGVPYAYFTDPDGYVIELGNS